MRRHLPRPFGQSVSGIRVVSLLMAIAVIGMLYQRLKNPETWKGFVAESPLPTIIAPTNQPAEPDPFIGGPNDQDEEEKARVQKQLEFVTDRSPLKAREMDAYWSLMGWSRARPLAEFEQRARSDLAFTSLWEQPELYRGQPVRLRLHVRRVLEYDAPENPHRIKKVYEAWGWTDESRSFPYVVVFSDPPAGLGIGTDVRTEIVFVGYFLKLMSYRAFDNARGAPLLVGQARLVTGTAAPAGSASDLWIAVVILAAGTMGVGWWFWSRLSHNRERRKSRFPEFTEMPGIMSDNDPAVSFHFGDNLSSITPSATAANEPLSSAGRNASS